jgi:hypothetical protein
VTSFKADRCPRCCPSQPRRHLSIDLRILLDSIRDHSLVIINNSAVPGTRPVLVDIDIRHQPLFLCAKRHHCTFSGRASSASNGFGKREENRACGQRLALDKGIQDAQTVKIRYERSQSHYLGTALTYAGCFTCRLRRKKCDEGKPKCKACRNLGLDCEYKRPHWWSNNDTRRKQKEHIKSIIKTTKTNEKNASVQSQCKALMLDHTSPSLIQIQMV